jgi:23S rRNA (adenine-C8)-methyltransferase
MNQSKYDRLRDWISENKLPRYRFNQITYAIFRDRISEFARMTTLPKHLRNDLIADFGNSMLAIKPVAQSHSRQATKYLFELSDHRMIEAVAMKYLSGWKSFCISSQVGCSMACAFCATGAIGLKRNLTADEITDQVLHFHLARDSIDSVSFMGTGEPLANPETFIALRMLTDEELFDTSPRRITVSTVGVIPGIQRLTQEFPQVNLVFSLHSPFNDQRNQLIPLNRAFPMERVMQCLDEHIQRTNRQVSMAYMLLSGVNDSMAHADALVALLKGRGAWDYLYHVNLIRYNPATGAPADFVAPEQSAVEQFMRWLVRGGLKVTLRQSFGANIDAACGQLHGRYRFRPHEKKETQ